MLKCLRSIIFDVDHKTKAREIKGEGEGRRKAVLHLNTKKG
jgi:hypothetical protein